MSFARIVSCSLPGLVLLLLTGCIDPVSPDVSRPEDQVVITGNVLSGPGPHVLELRLAAAFDQSLAGRFRRIRDATVVIVDHTTDRRYPLTEVLAGRYTTDAGQLVGTPGHRYSMEAQLPDGRTFRSRPETMPVPVPMDSLYFDFDPSSGMFGQAIIQVDYQDPAGKPRYYRWQTRATYEFRIGRSLCWINDGAGNTLPIASDRLTDGEIIREMTIRSLPGSRKLTLGYQMDVRQFTQTQAAHDYWSLVEEQVEQSGTTVDPPPSPLCGNVYNVDDPDTCTLGFVAAVGSSDYETLCLRASEIPEFTGFPIPVSDQRCLTRGVDQPPPYWTCSNTPPPSSFTMQ